MQIRSNGRVLMQRLPRRGALARAPFFGAVRRWPVLTTSACARHSGATSDRKAGFGPCPSSKHTLAAGFSGDSAVSVMAITGTPRACAARAASMTSGE